MHVIVDVLNVLHAVDSYKKILGNNFDLALDRLMQDLVNYRDWSADQMTVVIDGTEKPHAPLLAAGMRVLYSGPDKSADEIIEGEVSGSSFRNQILVVTSDTGIQQLVFSLGANYTLPSRFDETMKKIKAQRPRMSF